MLNKFDNITLTPSLARKLLLLNEIMPMNIPETILEIASSNLLDAELFGDDTEYCQFLEDNKLRAVVIYSDITSFLSKTIKFLAYKQIKPVLFVFDNLMLHSSCISKVMKMFQLSYKILLPKANLFVDNNIDFYFIDIETMKKIKNKIFIEREFGVVLIEAQAIFKSQYILENEMMTMPHIMSFTDQLIDITQSHNTPLSQYIFNKIIGEESFLSLLTTMKWKKWAEKRGYNINENIICYISGISKHLKV